MNQDLAISSSIKDKIYTIRGLQVILDEDLAMLYNVKTKRLNEQVKRNRGRFPKEFMFRITKPEFNNLRSQIATFNLNERKYLPFAFTEQGVSMLSSVLNSQIAINVSIQIMNAFVHMRRVISSNAQIFHRLDNLEMRHIEYDKKFEQVFDAIHSKDITPDKGIFFDGQVFDAYSFVSKLVKAANSSIVLIDNYIDESVLTLLSKRKKDVIIKIYTKNISKQLLLDCEKYNSQYPPLIINEFKQSHDRFIIIDNKEVYHFGASLKDLGKKWFAFSKFKKESLMILEKLEEI